MLKKLASSTGNGCRWWSLVLPDTLLALPKNGCQQRRLIAATSPSRSQEPPAGILASLFGSSAGSRGDHSQQRTTSHKEALSTSERFVEVQTHNVLPGRNAEYLKAHKNLVDYVAANQGPQSALKLNYVPMGNFHVFIGDNDQYVHFWSYDKGYPNLDSDMVALRKDPEAAKLTQEVARLLRDRSNQINLPFSFWPQTYSRTERDHVYEMRSYTLRAGTMVEWGNYWAKAIEMRDYKKSEAFLGMFSQVGDLYNVDHVWCYDSLEERRAAREIVWQKQQMQWSTIIDGTMPLIRHMSSKLMVTLPYSPTK